MGRGQGDRQRPAGHSAKRCSRPRGGRGAYGRPGGVDMRGFRDSRQRGYAMPRVATGYRVPVHEERRRTYAQNPPITLRLVGVVHSPGPAFGFPPLPALSLMSLCSFTMPPCPSVHVLGPGPGPVFSLLALAGAVCAKKDRRLKGCAPVPPHAFALQRRTIGDLPGKRPPARRSSFLQAHTAVYGPCWSDRP